MSSRGHWTQPTPLRRALSGKRQSVAGSVNSSVAGRPPSSTSRSHVPSLTSHAFYHPMNAQRLQAQRNAARPSTMGRQQQASSDENPPDDQSNNARQSLASNPLAHLAQEIADEGEAQQPPSPGTEMTEQETVDRITANTSPTHGHYTAASLSESVRPLKKKQEDGKNLTLKLDKSYMNVGSLPTPIRTPRSFRSSFLIPSRNDSAQNGSNREMQGGEKLESVASSPQLSPGQREKLDAKSKSDIPTAKTTGRNYQYFQGNTAFCLGGRLQNTKHRPVNIATGSLVAVPCVLFFIFSAPWIWYNISPAIPITFAYVFYISISSFVHASSSNPGVSLPFPAIYCRAPLLKLWCRYYRGIFTSFRHLMRTKIR